MTEINWFEPTLIRVYDAQHVCPDRTDSNWLWKVATIISLWLNVSTWYTCICHLHVKLLPVPGDYQSKGVMVMTRALCFFPHADETKCPHCFSANISRSPAEIQRINVAFSQDDSMPSVECRAAILSGLWYPSLFKHDIGGFCWK